MDVVRGLFAPMVAAAMPYGKKTGLEIDWNNPASTISKLAVISQTPSEFDFPGSPWPTHFHHAGPFHDDQGREPVPFAWEKLNGRPLVYASLGKLVNGLDFIYKSTLAAIVRLPEVQLVISTGGYSSLDDLRDIPSNAIVVRAAPQIELLKRAALCITHAGLNTVLESLAQGVLMVAIPIGFDQPGIAARIAHHGVGEFLKLEELTPETLMQAINKVLSIPSCRCRAHYFQKVIERTRGLDRAADIIEEALCNAVKRRESQAHFVSGAIVTTSQD